MKNVVSSVVQLQRSCWILRDYMLYVVSNIVGVNNVIVKINNFLKQILKKILI